MELKVKRIGQFKEEFQRKYPDMKYDAFCSEDKKLGRSRQIPFDNKVWEENREKVYYEVLVDKFSNPKLKSILINTGSKTLVEASPFDKIWGIGIDCNHPDATNPSKWRGLNLLGKVLEKVRKTIIETE